jgi:hypothetical protein
MNGTCGGGGIMQRAVVSGDAKKRFQMDRTGDEFIADHMLAQLLCEFRCDVAIPQKEAICLVGEKELAFCHGFEK